MRPSPALSLAITILTALSAAAPAGARQSLDKARPALAAAQEAVSNTLGAYRWPHADASRLPIDNLCVSRFTLSDRAPAQAAGRPAVRSWSIEWSKATGQASMTAVSAREFAVTFPQPPLRSPLRMAFATRDEAQRFQDNVNLLVRNCVAAGPRGVPVASRAPSAAAGAPPPAAATTVRAPAVAPAAGSTAGNVCLMRYRDVHGPGGRAVATATIRPQLTAAMLQRNCALLFDARGVIPTAATPDITADVNALLAAPNGAGAPQGTLPLPPRGLCLVHMTSIIDANDAPSLDRRVRHAYTANRCAVGASADDAYAFSTTLPFIDRNATGSEPTLPAAAAARPRICALDTSQIYSRGLDRPAVDRVVKTTILSQGCVIVFTDYAQPYPIEHDITLLVLNGVATAARGN